MLKKFNKRKLVAAISILLVFATLGGLFARHQYKQAKIKEAQTVLSKETDRVKDETDSIEENNNKAKTELKEAETKKADVEGQLSEKKSNVEGLEQKKKELEEKLGGEQ